MDRRSTLLWCAVAAVTVLIVFVIVISVMPVHGYSTTAPTSPTRVTIYEDDPAFDCGSMGNGRCTSVPLGATRPV